jgi:basic membrane lipoprotein Med (substrate-binding protein (PBP1-ABC) superfamily)
MRLAGSGGEIYTGNLANQGVQLAPYHDYALQIPDSMKTAIDHIKTDIIDGSISTCWETISFSPMLKNGDVNLYFTSF